VFHFHESRSRDGPREFLQDFRGVAKVDAYGVDDGVYLGSDGRIIASCCLAHARRKFDVAKSSHPRLAAEALAIFQQLYDIEDRGRDFPADERYALRQRASVPLLARLRTWLDEQAATALPKLKFGEAVRYARNQWSALVNYVEDGRRPIDNNATERDLRALTIGRNYAEFRAMQSNGRSFGGLRFRCARYSAYCRSQVFEEVQQFVGLPPPAVLRNGFVDSIQCALFHLQVRLNVLVRRLRAFMAKP
jgi:transposase